MLLWQNLWRSLPERAENRSLCICWVGVGVHSGSFEAFKRNGPQYKISQAQAGEGH